MVGEMFCDVVVHFKTNVGSTIIDFIGLSNNRDRLQSIVPINFFLDDSTNVKTVARLLRLWMMLLDPRDGDTTPRAWENDRNRFFSGQFTVAEFVQAHQLDILAIPAQNRHSNGVPRSLLKAKNLQEIAGIKFVWTYDITKHLYLEDGELHIFCMPCKIEPPSELPSQKALG